MRYQENYSLKHVVYKPMGAERAADRTIAQWDVPLHSSEWCHNNFALRISVNLRNTKIVLWIKYALVARWTYVAWRKKRNEIWLIQDLRICINLIQLS